MILVTGGAGFIGSHTCVELLNSGYEVVVIDNFSNSSIESVLRVERITNKKIKLYECDIRDKNSLSTVFKENAIDTVIHFAGLKSVGESCVNPLEYYENNVCGSVVLLETMKNFNVKRFVFSSSATVYGKNAVPYNESMKTGDVSNPYGRTKYMIEEILKDLFDSDNDWKIILLRYFNPIGAHESGLIGEDPSGIPNNLMPYISRVAVGKLPKLTVFGGDYETPDGTCIRDYIHVVDLARGHIKAIEKLSSINDVQAYNLGTGRGYSVLELINAFEKTTGEKINYSIGSRRLGDLKEVYADTSKAEKELGWIAKYDVNKMCEDTWRWQKNNPDGYCK